MNLFKSAVVCLVVVVMCGCDRRQPTHTVVTSSTPPVAPAPTLVATPARTLFATNVEDMELPESADSIGMEFKLIHAGTFIMGEGAEAHEVTLTKPFKMAVHEVTQAQYEQVMGVNPSYSKGADNPVGMVSWQETVEFCRRLTDLPAEKAAGNVYRLPTEAEWEYACRAGTTTMYSFGDDKSELEQYGWYYKNSDGKTHPVGSKLPNAWGLYDMHGNVWEWCQDWYGEYSFGGVTDPMGTLGPSRVVRGGRCGGPAAHCRSACRHRREPSSSNEYRGFRVCLSPSGK